MGVPTKVLTAIRIKPVGEFYTKWKVIETTEKAESPFWLQVWKNSHFTPTNTDSSLRDLEIESYVMLKSARIDEIYTAYPEKDSTATKFSDIKYDENIN